MSREFDAPTLIMRMYIYMYMFRLSIGVTVEIPRNVEFDSLMNYWRKEMRLGDANFFLSLFFLKQFLSQREERKRYYTKN